MGADSAVFFDARLKGTPGAMELHVQVRGRDAQGGGDGGGIFVVKVDPRENVGVGGAELGEEAERAAARIQLRCRCPVVR
jgi:hypothetical protein